MATLYLKKRGKNDWFDYWSARKKKIIIIKLKKLKQKNTGSIIVPAPFATALLVAYECKAHGDRNVIFNILHLF